MNRPTILFDRDFLFFITSRGHPARICAVDPRRASIKDMIESLGVPHTDVGAILIDNKEVDFSFVPDNYEEIRIKAVIPPLDVTRKTFLRPYCFDSVKFVADVNVGKLARCTTCNCELKQVDKQTILHKLEPKTKLFYTEFSVCPICFQIFWECSHPMVLKERLGSLGICVDH